MERALRDTDPDTRRQGRAERSRPMLMRIRRWLDTTATRVLPKPKFQREPFSSFT